jgi:Leucine-rich repeat (LRR) protein
LQFLNELSTLTKLQTLDLSQCHYDDISIQSISLITSLTDLNLSEIPLNSIDFIIKLENLQILDLSATRIHNLLPVALLPRLTKLYLLSTRVDGQSLLDLKKSKSLTKIIIDNDPDLRMTVQHVLTFINK